MATYHDKTTEPRVASPTGPLRGTVPAGQLVNPDRWVRADDGSGQVIGTPRHHDPAYVGRGRTWQPGRDPA